jgi:hypothetical protein
MRNSFQTLYKDDILLLQWIHDNISENQHILVSWGDSGQYLSSITQRLSVSYYSRYTNYSALMNMLTTNASDLNAIPLLLEYNVTSIYIGSKGVSYSLELPYYRHFNASLFLTVPYFTLTKEFGSAYLFEFNRSAAWNDYNTYI